MRVVVAPQEFKGSLTAAEAARAIAAGVRDALPDAEIDEAPMSDGGAGLVDAMLAARGGRRIESLAHDPLMRPITAAWAMLPDGTAVIEMAAASGLVLVTPEERNPLIATTYGTGEMIRAALDAHASSIIVGVGGSATVDAGAGAMQALGARLLDASGAELQSGGAALSRLERIDLAGRDPRLERMPIVVASDVTNMLCGPTGAATMFGPQKGASPDAVRVLEAALQRFPAVVARDFSIDLLTMAGGGAAGGLGAGLVVLAGATIEPGAPIVADAIGLDARIARADLVITGEGRLDAQTAHGKTAAAVAGIARAHNKRTAIIAGSIAADYDQSDAPYDITVSATLPGMPIEEAMQRAAELLREAAKKVMD